MINKHDIEAFTPEQVDAILGGRESLSDKRRRKSDSLTKRKVVNVHRTPEPETAPLRGPADVFIKQPFSIKELAAELEELGNAWHDVAGAQQTIRNAAVAVASMLPTPAECMNTPSNPCACFEHDDCYPIGLARVRNELSIAPPKCVNPDDVRSIITTFQAKRVTLAGCTDRFCYITGPRKGQVTNGGCRCLVAPTTTQRMALQRLAFWTQEMIDQLEKLL